MRYDHMYCSSFQPESNYGLKMERDFSVKFKGTRDLLRFRRANTYREDLRKSILDIIVKEAPFGHDSRIGVLIT